MADALADKTQQLNIKTKDVPFAPKKPSGSRGQKCDLKTNMWKLTLEKNIPIYKYDVRMYVKFQSNDPNVPKLKELTKQTRDDFTEQVRKEGTVKLYKQLLKEHPTVFGNSTFYDRAAILYSLSQLKDQDLDLAPGFITHSAFTDHVGFQVTLKKVTEGYQTNTNDLIKAVNPRACDQDLTLVEALNIIVGQEALLNSDKFVTYGNGTHYLYDNACAGFRVELPPLPEGKYMGIGAKKTVKVVEGPPADKCAAYVGIDIKKTAFHGDYQPLPDKLLSFFGGRGTMDFINDRKRQCRDLLRGLFVSTTHNKKPQQFAITGLGASARDTIIEVDGKKKSVEQYYAEKYNKSLKYPNLFLIIGRIRGKDGAFPAECLTVAPNQRVIDSQQTPDQNSITIKECAVLPKLRIMQSEKMKDCLDISSNSLSLKKCGIKVEPGCQELVGRVLQAPGIVFGEKKQAQSADNAKWSGDHCKYLAPVTIAKWLVVGLFDPNDSRRFNLQAYVKKLTDRMHYHGINVQPPKIEHEPRANKDKVKAFLEFASTSGAQFVFFVSSDSVILHDYIKLVGTQLQVNTQEVKLSKAMAVLEKNQVQTLDNIVNKTNLKLGGVNYAIQLPAEPATQGLFNTAPADRKLYIGIEFSHPAPLSAAEKARNTPYRTPSVLGWGANYHKHPQYFLGDYRYVKPRESDMLGQDLKGLIKYTINKSREANGNLPPKHIVMYVNGLSQGQWNLVNNSYLPSLKEACKELNASYCPKFTIIAVSKDHNERLYKKNIGPNENRAAEQNIRPGTVVDSTIVSPSVSEFFLNAHSAFQGTAKTPKYAILVDEFNMSMDAIETMTHGLCFMHGIVNMAISVPAPLKVAGECAKRGLNVFHVATEDRTEETFDLSECNTFVNVNKKLASVRYNA